MDFHTVKKLHNGVEIPVLGFGVFKAPDGEETYQAVRWALEAGYRHIDTAMVYRNERSTGAAIRESGIPREEIFVTTKLWNTDMREDRQAEAYEESLDRLGLDYVDLYLIHWPVPEKYIESWHVLESLYQQKRMRAIGVCNCNVHHLKSLMETATIVPMINQMECHPYLTQVPVRDFCVEHQIAFESYSPLGGSTSTLLSNEKLGKIASKYGKTIPQIILRWHLQMGNIVIPKSVHKERIEANKNIFDFALAEDDMQAILAMNEDHRFGNDPDNFSF